jgi:5-methyltetrahydrofolate--homocysteine methyltransferase
MRKAAEVLTKSAVLKIDTLCELLDAADRHHKKYAMYNAGLAMPEEVCYQGVQAKIASVPTTVSLITGSTFELEAIKKAGLRDKVKIMIGGGQMDDQVRSFSGADAYGKDAMEAVKLAKGWIGE